VGSRRNRRLLAGDTTYRWAVSHRHELTGEAGCGRVRPGVVRTLLDLASADDAGFDRTRELDGWPLLDRALRERDRDREDRCP